MSKSLCDRLFHELNALWLIDPHTHINPHSPASTSLGDLLGYHYYTELVHSAGVPRERIEGSQLSPEEKIRQIVAGLSTIDNTVQHQWLLDILAQLLDFPVEALTPANADQVVAHAATRMAQPGWDEEVLRRSRLKGLFLTNDFDDPLTGFDTRRYIPCLRTDDLVFQLHRGEVCERLEKASGMAVCDAASLARAIGRLFEHFQTHGAKACAISLPTTFAPRPVSLAEADRGVQQLLSGSLNEPPAEVSQFVFWKLAEYCHEFQLPFDLMIGVTRKVYPGGVFQGQDLFDSRVSLMQYRELFNAFPQVKFPVSVLASGVNQELVSFSWIFPNVIAHGHWWYSNTPTYIRADAAARLEAAPKNKQIGYYSDMYKLEFALPKFGMYKRVLAQVLAENFVQQRGWSEERAVALGTQILRGNVEATFGVAVETV